MVKGRLLKLYSLSNALSEVDVEAVALSRNEDWTPEWQQLLNTLELADKQLDSIIMREKTKGGQSTH